MIRICVAAFAVLALAACSKAPEDTTARYALGGGVGTITVQAAANGDARVESGQQIIVRNGGTEYLLLTDSKGQFAAKVSDFIAAMGEMMREEGMKPTGLGPQSEYDLVKKGTETVAGVAGDVWNVSAKPAKDAKAAPPTETIEAVISSDPALANVGKALSMQTRLGTAGMRQVQGGQGNLEKRVEEMLDKGMVLRFGDALKLDKVEKAPIDAKVFALPAVVDKTALKARLNAERARARAAVPPAAAPADPAPAPAPAPTPAPKAK